jgi:hypothetical protein
LGINIGVLFFELVKGGGVGGVPCLVELGIGEVFGTLPEDFITVFVEVIIVFIDFTGEMFI